MINYRKLKWELLRSLPVLDDDTWNKIVEFFDKLNKGQ